MRKLFNRFRMAFHAARIGWAQPSMFSAATFDCMARIMEMLLNVAKSKRPMGCKMALVTVEEYHEVCAIWAGPSVASSPFTRIDELIKENAELKEQLCKYTGWLDSPTK